MTLSSLTEPLTASHLYPDRVRIIYRYNIPPISQQTFAAELGGHGSVLRGDFTVCKLVSIWGTAQTR